MEYIALALEHDKSHLLKKVRLKISEWLDFRNVKSNVISTVYLEFFDSGEPQVLDHVYVIIPKNDFERIILPTENEIERENRILNKNEISRKLDIKSRFIPPISIEKVFEEKQSEKNVLIRINLKEFEVDNSKMNRFQLCFCIRDSFRKKTGLLSVFDSSWDWIYEMPIHPLIIDRNEFADIAPIKMDLELWVMIEPAMYDSVSYLNIRATRSFDRFIILPDDIAGGLGRHFVSPKALCIRWFFPGFTESGLGAEIILSKKKSTMEREKRYINKINSDENNFFSHINQILNDSRIACVDFYHIIDGLRNPEFQRFLEILFELMYHRNDNAFSKLGEFVDILEEFQDLKYGRYYFHMYRLLNQMRVCEKVQDIIMPKIKKWLEEFVEESEFTNKAAIDLFTELRYLIDVIEQFYYYSIPEEKYMQKKEVLSRITRLRDTADYKLINPESYLLAEEVLIKWEHLVEMEFKQFVGLPRVNVELKTKKLLHSERIHLIFDITNISDVPLVNLAARLLPSEEYNVLEQERRGTTKRKRLTKSYDREERVFSPEFVIFPKIFQNFNIKLEIMALTEEEERFSEKFDWKIELFHKDIEFKGIEQNPYIAGKPVKEKQMFFGRKDIFEQIRGTIVGIQVIQAILYGQYRIGKTSVLCQLMNELRGKYIPVLTISHGLETGDCELLRFWSIQILNAIEKRKKKVPKLPDYENSANPYKEFQKFLDRIIKELEEAKIIFMIDEYDLIDDLLQSKEIGEEFFRLLDWMIKLDRIELIMAGRLPIDALKTEEWKEIARPFAHIRLGPLDRENTIELITKPVEGYIGYDDSAVERILRLTNCHPYLTQLCCSTLVSYHNLKRKNVLTYSDVEDCIPEMIDLGRYGLEAMISADTTPTEQIVLRVMAAMLREQTSITEQELVVVIRGFNPSLEDKDIKNAVSYLEKKEVIRSITEETRSFKFTCELFRYWIKANLEPLGRRAST